MIDGQIVTFYSFKGGVGRTMALANTAALLAKEGKKVLIIDFDLEAPGVEKYFENKPYSLSRTRKECDGVVDIFESFSRGKKSNITWKESLIKARSTRSSISVDILPAGRDNIGYVSKLQNINWEYLFDELSLSIFLENLRNEWKSNYDFILIDSRTGISDIGGICTIYLPDVMCFLFTTNINSLDGCINVVNRAKRARDKIPYDRGHLITIPIPSRDESRTEYESSLRWKDIFINKLRTFYAEWIPENTNLNAVIDNLKVPYIPYWSFGDRLPVIEEGTNESTIGFAYERIALLLTNDFDWNKVRGGYNLEEASKIINSNKENENKRKMNIENYINERIDSQIRWYSVKSAKNKRDYFVLITSQIVLAAILPVITNLEFKSEIISKNLLISLIGVAIVIITGVLSISKSQEKWVNYRKTSERLKQEKYKFLSSSLDYQEDNFQEFVRMIEDILTGEVSSWERIASKDKSSPNMMS